jgi:hypothetical protein
MKQLVLAVALTAHLVPGVAQQAPSETARKVGLKMLTVQTGTFQCSVQADPTQLPCKAIPVIVLTDGTTCIAQLPYATLSIGGTNRARTPVTWSLIAPAGYTFDPNKGIQITHKSGPIQPADVWEQGVLLPSGDYLMILKSGAKAADFDHVANVIDPNGVPCRAGDPVIHNANN